MTFTIQHRASSTLTATCDACATRRTGSRTAVTEWQRTHSCRTDLLERAHRAGKDQLDRRADAPTRRGPELEPSGPLTLPHVPVRFHGAKP